VQIGSERCIRVDSYFVALTSSMTRSLGSNRACVLRPHATSASSLHPHRRCTAAKPRCDGGTAAAPAMPQHRRCRCTVAPRRRHHAAVAPPPYAHPTSAVAPAQSHGTCMRQPTMRQASERAGEWVRSHATREGRERYGTGPCQATLHPSTCLAVPNRLACLGDA
jgi:hypothetical protein